MASRDPQHPELEMSYEELKAKYDDRSEPCFIMTPEFVYMNKARLKIKEMDDEYKRVNRDRGPFDEYFPHQDPSKTRLMTAGFHTMTITEENRPQLVEFCNAALHKYNAENQVAEFVFDELIRVNLQYISGRMYYITFAARDAAANDGAAHTFQAQVHESSFNNPKLDIMMCQIKPN